MGPFNLGSSRASGDSAEGLHGSPPTFLDGVTVDPWVTQEYTQSGGFAIPYQVRKAGSTSKEGSGKDNTIKDKILITAYWNTKGAAHLSAREKSST